MDSVSALEQASEEGRRVVAGVRAEQTGDPTPCPEFDVRALLNHFVGGTVMFTGAVAKGTPEETSGVENADLIGDDPLDAYSRAVAANLAAWREPDVMDTVVTLPFATLPAPVALNVNLLETLVHAWDIAKATGQPTTLDQDLAETTLEFARQMISDELRDGTTFATEVVITEDAHPTDRLAAFTGRRP